MGKDLGTSMNWLRQTRFWTCHGQIKFLIK